MPPPVPGPSRPAPRAVRPGRRSATDTAAPGCPGSAAHHRAVILHPSVEKRLAGLAPDQRAAATAAPGPTLCIAPAGSGKTTTLVARIAWLLDSGAADPGAIAAITFNRRAAVELAERLAAVLEPLAVGADRDAVRVRTFHALGLEIL